MKNTANNFLTSWKLIFSFQLLFALFFILQIQKAYCQPITAQVSFVSLNANQVIGTCNMELDSSSIQSIELELIDLMTKEILFSHEFVYDQTSGLPTGLTWSRNGNEISLGLGSLPKRIAWQGKTRIKNGSGQWSNYLTFLFN